MNPDLNAVVAGLVDAQFEHLEHRHCTAEQPMPLVDKDKYRWHHGDEVEVKPFFNLVLCECPHCGFSFTCLPRSVS